MMGIGSSRAYTLPSISLAMMHSAAQYVTYCSKTANIMSFSPNICKGSYLTEALDQKTNA